MDDYRKFMRIKRIPQYRFIGSDCEIPDEYAQLVGVAEPKIQSAYTPRPDLFDYQAAIAALAIRKQKFAVFADCGLGKTLILLEYARHCARVLPRGRAVLIVSPLMVVPQTIAESVRWYGDDLGIEQVRASDAQSWATEGTSRIGITNYEAIMRIEDRGRIGAVILDESSMLKNHYGKFGLKCIELGKGLEWKLALTGTPAPNDRIEYGNHAVFLDRFRSTNEFLARYFVNRGETSERWELRPHAIKPFYRDLSHWSIFLSNPAVYGWKDNCETLPPIRVHISHVDLTTEQRKEVQKITGGLMATRAGGITSRGKLARLAKGFSGGVAVESNKPAAVAEIVAAGGDRSSIVWCKYNDEQDAIAEMIRNSASIDGETPIETRMELIRQFKSRERKTLISKPKILGFGLNLQVATRQVFSTLQDSYEEYYQAVKRSNRYGSTEPLDVFIPVTEIEMPMVETVLNKADRVQQDTEEQEALFRECGYGVTL
jgi:superfamily II DNA or RNA helicase